MRAQHYAAPRIQKAYAACRTRVPFGWLPRLSARFSHYACMLRRDATCMQRRAYHHCARARFQASSQRARLLTAAAWLALVTVPLYGVPYMYHTPCLPPHARFWRGFSLRAATLPAHHTCRCTRGRHAATSYLTCQAAAPASLYHLLPAYHATFTTAACNMRVPTAMWQYHLPMPVPVRPSLCQPWFLPPTFIHYRLPTYKHSAVAA